MTRHDLLADNLIEIVTTAAAERVFTSLPGVFARLARSEAIEFAALQAHQFHAWHAFLSQLAALVAERGPGQAFPKTEAAWRAALSTLVGGAHEPWCLVVSDLAKPAFMQPPVPEGSLEDFKGEVACPDEIDILVTAKNHDVKAARIASPRPEHWIYALVSLQTMQGFLGAGNYGIARMNGGFASRPSIGAAADASWSTRVLRDATVLLGARDSVVATYGYSPSGKALLWTESWNGVDSFALKDCHPWFLEICRRVRMISNEGGALRFRATSSKVARIAAKEQKGNTGDPWTPVNVGEAKALTVSAEGFSYGVLQALLFDANWQPGAAQLARREDGASVTMFAWAVVRGQGKTEGLHSRALPVPGRALKLLATPDGRSKLGVVSRLRVERADVVRGRVLRPALQALIQGGPDRIDFKDGRMDGRLARLDARIDEIFFDRLFLALDDDLETADRRWIEELLALAKRELEAAYDTTPVPSIRRFRGIAVAENVFRGSARKQFPQAFAVPKENDATP